MKVVAGHLALFSGFERNLKQFVQAPVLKQRRLNPYQGILQAIWSDERIASACVSMASTDQVNENTDAARRFERMNPSEIQGLRVAFLDAGPIMCDLRRPVRTCHEDRLRLGDLTRFLTYHEHYCCCGREAYAQPQRQSETGTERTSTPPVPLAQPSSTSPSSCRRSIAFSVEQQGRTSPMQQPAGLRGHRPAAGEDTGRHENELARQRRVHGDTAIRAGGGCRSRILGGNRLRAGRLQGGAEGMHPRVSRRKGVVGRQGGLGIAAGEAGRCRESRLAPDSARARAARGRPHSSSSRSSSSCSERR